MNRALRSTSLLALLLLAVPLAAQPLLPLAPVTDAARPSPEQLLRRPGLLARFLGLDPAQTAKLKELLTQLNATLKPLREEQKALYQELHAALDADNPDPTEVGEIVIALYDGREEIRAAFATFDTAFSAILTPAQLAKWNALKEALKLLFDPPEPGV
jgi:Spy/CpxP family protein refolding chaperone